jgi:hypothetical protein
MKALEKVCDPAFDFLAVRGVDDLTPELAAKVAAHFFDKG